jgi:hypothetical protein
MNFQSILTYVYLKKAQPLGGCPKFCTTESHFPANDIEIAHADLIAFWYQPKHILYLHFSYFMFP